MRNPIILNIFLSDIKQEPIIKKNDTTNEACKKYINIAATALQQIDSVVIVVVF